MSLYKMLLAEPPILKVAKGSREIIFNTVSCMCDNRHKLRLKKNSEGDFKLSGCGFALSNWQMKFDKDDIEWKADEGKWSEVIKMINSGTEKIETIKNR